MFAGSRKPVRIFVLPMPEYEATGHFRSLHPFRFYLVRYLSAPYRGNIPLIWKPHGSNTTGNQHEAVRFGRSSENLIRLSHPLSSLPDVECGNKQQLQILRPRFRKAGLAPSIQPLAFIHAFGDSARRVHCGKQSFQCI